MIPVSTLGTAVVHMIASYNYVHWMETAAYEPSPTTIRVSRLQQLPTYELG